MLSKNQIESFLDSVGLAVRQAGHVAKSLQGKVQNEGKQGEVFEGDSQALIAKRAAKTVVDEIVQEIILLASLEILDRDITSIDAEESTPSKIHFQQQPSKINLIIDPVDGTMEYIDGKDNYSICVGLVEDGFMVSAMVYFPARDHFYFLDADGQSRLTIDAYSSGLKNATLLSASINQACRTLYKNSRMSDLTINCLTTKGYEVLDDTYEDICCPDAILQCLTGHSIAYLSHSRQMRDILLGAIVAAIPGGYATDWTGQQLKWPKSGRVPEAIFGIGEPPESILQCLSGDKVI